MLYLITLFVLFFFSYKSDICHYKGDTCYKLILLWFIFLSGFQYCIGSDTISYMREFDRISMSDVQDSSFFTFDRRQYGWQIVFYLFKTLFGDFFLFKLAHAIFINTVIFSFIRKHSSMPFMAIALYFCFCFFDFNFNILRQSAAIAFFLLAYDKFLDKKYLCAAIYTICSFQFHNTAIVLIVVPLLTFFSINYKTYKWALFFILFLFTSLSFTPIGSYMEGLSIFLDSNEATSNAAAIANHYAENERYSSGNATMRLLIFVVQCLPPILVIYYSIRSRYIKHNFDIKICLLYVIFVVLGMYLPIVSRVTMYFTIAYICSIANVANSLCGKFVQSSKLVVLLAVYMFFTFIPIRELFSINQSSQIRNIDNYYPYYTIFSKQTSEIRVRAYGKY